MPTGINGLRIHFEVHWENYISISFHSEWDMIVVTLFEPNGNSSWFKNCHHDHIPFNVKGNRKIVFSVITDGKWLGFKERQGVWDTLKLIEYPDVRFSVFHSSMKNHHVKKANFAKKKCTVLWFITFSERIYTWLLDQKLISYKISDMYMCIFIDE